MDERLRARVEKFWTSMSDFPDLSVVFDALCKRCKRPCEECRSRINRLRPAARSVARVNSVLSQMETRGLIFSHGNVILGRRIRHVCVPAR